MKMRLTYLLAATLVAALGTNVLFSKTAETTPSQVSLPAPRVERFRIVTIYPPQTLVSGIPAMRWSLLLDTQTGCVWKYDTDQRMSTIPPTTGKFVSVPIGQDPGAPSVATGTELAAGKDKAQVELDVIADEAKNDTIQETECKAAQFRALQSAIK
ncbi:MAG TPA: hypothetical protein VGT08_05900 [Terracidiphilus sp.]|nr:hypothetical protein [Terracidiphilus sp.]